MATEHERKQTVPRATEHTAGSEQQWFDVQNDFEDGETLKAKRWETQHRLADDNTVLGNIHEGSQEADDLDKSGTAAPTLVSEPLGVILPDEQPQDGNRIIEELDSDPQPDPEADETSSVEAAAPASAALYEPPDFGDFGVQLPREPEDRGEIDEETAAAPSVRHERGDAGAASAGGQDPVTKPAPEAPEADDSQAQASAEAPTSPPAPEPTDTPPPPPEPTPAQISGLGGLVVEDEINAVSGQLSIFDPDAGEQAFQADQLEGMYGSFQIGEDGFWSYQLAVEKEEVQSLAAGQEIIETVTVSSVDGTTHTLDITVRGTNDAPVFQSVISQTATEDGASINGQVAAADVDAGAALSYSTSADIAGLTMNSDGTYTFDPGHAEYQDLGAGEQQVITVPVTVTDEHGAQTDDQFTITLTGTNDAAQISGLGGLVVEDESNTLSGRLTIADPDAGEAAFQPGLVKGTHGSFQVGSDGSWSYQLAVVQQNVQSLAEGEQVSEMFEVRSVDGTTHQLEITVQGTNDAPQFATVKEQQAVEDGAPVYGQVAAVDIDHGAQLTYTAGTKVSGLVFNSDGTYSFDPTHDDYQALGEGEQATIVVPVSATDEHGASAAADLVLTVTGTNDAPQITFGQVHEVMRESFENFRSKNGWHIERGGDNHEVTGDHGTVWSLTDEGLEVQRGSIGGSRAQDGASHIELDGHANLSLTTTVTTLPGEDYLLSFAYKPRPGRQDSSDMTVSFGGREVAIEADQSGAFELVSNDAVTWQIADGGDGWSIINLNYTGVSGEQNELSIGGAGASDSFGAYVDTISLSYSTPTDQYVTTFVENGSAVPVVDSLFMISDIDDEYLASASVSLTGSKESDQLVVGELPEGISAHTQLQPDGSLTVELSGDASLADYQQALRQIGFANSSDNPDVSDRLVEIAVHDGNDQSQTLVTTVQVVGVNDAPRATGGSLATGEDQAIVLQPHDFGFSDVDGGELFAVRVGETVQNGELRLYGEPLEPGQSVNIGDIEVGGLTFVPSQHVSGQGEFSFQVHDGSDWSEEAASTTVDIAPIADVPDLEASLGTARLIPLPGTGEVVTSTIDAGNYQDTDSGFRVLGRVVEEDGTLSEASVDHVRTGNGGFAPSGANAGPNYQLGVNLEHQISEELIVEFDQATPGATVTVARLFANENRAGGHEAGQYVLKYGGEVVGEGTFHATSGHTMELALSGDNGEPFDQVVFTAQTTYADGSTRPGDASDYMINQVSWQQEVNQDMAWEVPLHIEAGLVDRDGSESLGPVVIDGVPPGAVLSAGELIGGGEQAEFQATSFTLAHDYQARVVFESETAGYRNSLGYYKIDPETGAIGDVQMLWNNASLRGSGGTLTGGESAIGLECSAGDQVGFFLVANGARKNDYESFGEGRYEFRSGTADEATVSDQSPRLVYVQEDGSEIQVRGNIFHSAADSDSLHLNPDGIRHTRGELDSESGTIKIGFEDLRGGGDNDFDDSIFTVEIGVDNAQDLAKNHAGYGTWQVDAEDIEGLTMTLPGEYEEPFDLSVSVSASEEAGGRAAKTTELAIDFSEEGPYVADERTEETVEMTIVEGVDMASFDAAASGQDSSGSGGLDGFAANSENDSQALPQEVQAFTAGSEDETGEEIPAADEGSDSGDGGGQSEHEPSLDDSAMVYVEDDQQAGSVPEEPPTIV